MHALHAVALAPPWRTPMTPSGQPRFSTYPPRPHLIAGSFSPASDVRAARRAALFSVPARSSPSRNHGVLGEIGEDTVLAGEVRFYSAANVGGG